MTSTGISRENLGFDDWFVQQSAPFQQEGCDFARISAVDRGAYRLMDGIREGVAEISGRLHYQLEESDALPCVGDWVTAQWYNDDKEAIIHHLLPRKSYLSRRKAGDSNRAQMIGANIDVAFVVQSCHFDFNPRRLDRYLVMAANGGVQAVILLTKTDLISKEELVDLQSTLRNTSNAGTTPIITLSNITGEGLPELRQWLQPGKTSCLIGSSGVGKTTLINRLTGAENFATAAVSASGEGTHTTTRRQLIILPDGGLLIDTPGMRELGMTGTAAGVDSGFAQFGELAAQCRYADCSHNHEPGCAIRAALEQGTLSYELYESYVKLKKETQHYELTSLEKRRKDKSFGKFVKSVKKNMKKGYKN